MSGREYDYIALNVDNKVLKNKEVRQAIMYAIDKNAIIANVYNSKYYKSEFPLDYGSWLCDKKSENHYNVDKVYQVLQDNGWEYKYGSWQKYVDYYTRRLDFKLVVYKENEQRSRVAEIIKQQLEAVGIKITIIYATENQYNNYINNRNYDMILCNSYAVPNINLNKYFGDGNIANYYNEEARNIINDVKNITDKGLLKDKYKRLYEIYIDDAPYISLYNNYSIVAYSKNLIGSMSVNWFNSFYNISTWGKK